MIKIRNVRYVQLVPSLCGKIRWARKIVSFLFAVGTDCFGLSSSFVYTNNEEHEEYNFEVNTQIVAHSTVPAWLQHHLFGWDFCKEADNIMGMYHHIL